MGRLGRNRPEKKSRIKQAPLRMISDKGGVGKIKEIKERGGREFEKYANSSHLG